MSQRHKRVFLGKDSAEESATDHGEQYYKPSFFSPDLGDNYGEWDNVSVDSTGLVITLVYPESLAYDGAALKSCFTVYVNGVSKTVSTGVLDDDTITLTMAALIPAGAKVEIKFINDTHLTRTSDDAELPTDGISVGNYSNPPGTFDAAAIPTAGHTIVMSNAANVAAVEYGGSGLKDCFTVMVGEAEATVASAAIGSGVITLTLVDWIIPTDEVTVEFANDGDVLRVSDDGVVADTTDPIEATNSSTKSADFATASVSTNGLTVTVSSDVILDYTGGSDLGACFTVTKDETPAAITSAAIATDTTNVAITMTAAINAGEVVTVEFTNDNDLVRKLTGDEIADVTEAITATNGSTVSP